MSEKTKYNPEANYTWQPDSKVTISGVQAQAIIQLGNFLKGTGLATIPFLADMILRDMVETGVAKEVTTQEQLNNSPIEVISHNKKEEGEIADAVPEKPKMEVVKD